MATHAGLSFACEYQNLVTNWELNTNSLVLLTVENEDQLLDVLDACWFNKVPYKCFIEPDINNEHTAVALFPDDDLLKELRKLPLALKDTKDPRWIREAELRKEVN